MSFIRLLDTKMWHHDKKETAEKDKMFKRNKTKAILQEMERAHLALYPNKEESGKKFDKWLENIAEAKEPVDLIKENIDDKDFNSNNLIEDENVESKQTLISNKTFQTSQPSFISSSKTKSSKATVDFATSSLIRSELPAFMEANLKENTEKKFKPILKKKEISVNAKPWNFSTKTREVEYLPNLGDFYPRDQYSNLPVNEDLVLLNQVLRGMSVAEIREFMKKNNDVEKTVVKKRSEERPVHFKPRNIVDAQSKVRNPPGKVPVDLAGLTLCNDAESFAFKEAMKVLSKNNSDKRISKSEDKIMDDKLKVVEREFGKDMSDIMRDRHGKMSQRYEKVFIC